MSLNYWRNAWLVFLIAGFLLLGISTDFFSRSLDSPGDYKIYVYHAPRWDPLSHPMKATVVSTRPVEVILREENTGHVIKENDSHVRLSRSALSGETWILLVKNPIGAGTKVNARITCYSYLVVAGTLILLSSIFYLVSRRKTSD